MGSTQIRKRHKFRPGKHLQLIGFRSNTDGAYVSKLVKGARELLVETTMET
jgi:hypothetical protein